MAGGYIRLHRTIKNHWIYSDPRYFQIWIECLLSARWSDDPKTELIKGVKYTIKRGQFIFSRRTFAQRLEIDESVIRYCFDHMIKDEMLRKIWTHGRNKPTIYEICNYDIYQYSDFDDKKEDLEAEKAYEKPTETIDMTAFECNQRQLPPTEHPQNDPQNPLQLQGLKDINATTTTTERPLNKKVNKDNLKDMRKTEEAERLYQLYPRKKGKADALKKLPKLIEKYGSETIERAISKYADEMRGKDPQYIQYASRFFNNGYLDYIDEDEPEQPQFTELIEEEVYNS